MNGGKNNIILLLGLAGFMVMADNWVVSPILPIIAANLHIEIPMAGLLITSYMIPFGIFQVVFGPLADRFGKKEVITCSMIIFSIATGLCALGTGMRSLAVFRALTGIFAASVMPISFALIGDTFPLHQRQKAIGTFLGISFLGQGASMALGGTIAFLSNWQGVFTTYALLSLIPTTLLIKNYRRLPSVKSTETHFFKTYLDLLTNPKSLFLYIVIMLEGTFIIGSFSYGGSYLAQTFRFDSLHIGLIMTGFGIMSVVGGKLSGKLVNIIGSKNVLSLGLSAAAMADIIIWISGTRLVVFALSIALMGLGFIFAHSTLVTRATEFAQKSRGAAMSLVAFCFMGSGGIGTAIGGRIIEAHGIKSIFMIYGMGLLSSLLASTLMIRDDNRNPEYIIVSHETTQ